MTNLMKSILLLLALATVTMANSVAAVGGLRGREDVMVRMEQEQGYQDDDDDDFDDDVFSYPRQPVRYYDECDTDKDCARDEKCMLDRERCVKSSSLECVKDKHCNRNGWYCDFRLYQCVRGDVDDRRTCKRDVHCDRDEYCDLFTRYCRED